MRQQILSRKIRHLVFTACEVSPNPMQHLWECTITSDPNKIVTPLKEMPTPKSFMIQCALNQTQSKETEAQRTKTKTTSWNSLTQNQEPIQSESCFPVCNLSMSAAINDETCILSQTGIQLDVKHQVQLEPLTSQKTLKTRLPNKDRDTIKKSETHSPLTFHCPKFQFTNLDTFYACNSHLQQVIMWSQVSHLGSAKDLNGITKSGTQLQK